jgi:hypothetical protein
MVYGLSPLDEWTDKVINFDEFVLGYIGAGTRFYKGLPVSLMRFFMEVVFLSHDAELLIKASITNIWR